MYSNESYKQIVPEVVLVQKMTVKNKGKLRQSVYELVENDDAILDKPKGNEAVVDALTQAFLEGSLSVSYDPEENALHWSLLQVPVSSASCTELLNIGANLAEKGILDDAAALLEQAAKLCPEDGSIRVNLGHVYQDKGLLDKAIVQYKCAIRIDPNIVDAHERLGTTYASKGLLAEAISSYRRALRLNPLDFVTLCNLGKVYLDSGLVEEAIARLKQATKLNPGSANAHNTLGLAYSKRGHRNDAIAEFGLAVELEPGNALYHSNLADEYYRNRMWKEAIKEYKIVKRLSPESAAACNNLGAAYAQAGILDQALPQFRKAIRLDPKSEIAQMNFLATQKMQVSQQKKDTKKLAEAAKTLSIDEPLWEVPIIKGQMNKAENVIEKWFQNLKGDVIGELAFIDKTTFGYLDSIPKCCGIRIMASNIKDPEKCRIRAERCAADRPYLEIMNINKLHKRWIGSNESFFVEIGADLKSDALGHSTHTIRRLGVELYQREVRQFADLWETAEKKLREKLGVSNITKTLFFSTFHKT